MMWLAAVVSCKKEIADQQPVTPPIINDTSKTDLTTIKFTVEAASDWTQLLTRSSGWIGGDGIFSIPQSGVDSIGAGSTGKTLILFSDTQMGSISNGVLSADWSPQQRMKTNIKMEKYIKMKVINWKQIEKAT